MFVAPEPVSQIMSLGVFYSFNLVVRALSV